VAEHLVSSHSL